MEFANAIKYGFKNYANFKGVVDRRTYWWWYLFTVAVAMAIQLIVTVLTLVVGGSSEYILDGSYVPATNGLSLVISSLGSLASLGLALPSLALQVRRLRDVGTNPLFLLFGLIPVAVLLIGMVVGAAIGAASGSYGYDNALYAIAGLFLGMLPGLILGIGFGIWLIVLLAKPTKTAAQGNKYAVA